MNFQELSVAFFQYVLVQIAHSREVPSQAISLFEQYTIHVRVTNNVHQIVKHYSLLSVKIALYLRVRKISENGRVAEMTFHHYCWIEISYVLRMNFVS